MRSFSLFAVVLVGSLVASSAQANVTDPAFVDPANSISFDGWNQLNRTGMGGGDQTTATNALNNGFGSNVAGSGDALVKRLSGNIYPAGAGLYQDGVLEISDSTIPSDITGLTFQAIVNDFSGGTFGASSIALNYNGGAQALAPALQTFDGTNYYRFHWDLSSVSEPIAAYNFTITLPFSQTLALQTNAIGVPEPATMALVGVGLVGAVLRRRRAT